MKPVELLKPKLFLTVRVYLQKSIVLESERSVMLSDYPASAQRAVTHVVSSYRPAQASVEKGDELLPASLAHALVQ